METMSGPVVRYLPPVIGLYSPAQQSGKSTIAQTLATSYGYKHISFADPIRTMFNVLHRYATQDEDQDGYIPWAVRKDEPRPEMFNICFRHFAEHVGTRWGREYDQDLWVKIWAQRVQRYWQSNSNPVVADDIRFPNEYWKVRELGGYLIKVVRPGAVSSSELEGQLEDFEFDHTIINDEVEYGLSRAVYEYMETFNPFRK